LAFFFFEEQLSQPKTARLKMRGAFVIAFGFAILEAFAGVQSALLLHRNARRSIATSIMVHMIRSPRATSDVRKRQRVRAGRRNQSSNTRTKE
jgi:hypothetical protein